MQSSGVNTVLLSSAAEVLETMFFTSVLGEASNDIPGTRWVSAELSFRGATSGRFGLRLGSPAARTVAANFLAREEETISETETGEVVCELANMVCGSVLSRLEIDTTFELSHPRLSSEEGSATEPAGSSCLLEIPEGLIKIWLNSERSV